MKATAVIALLALAGGAAAHRNLAQAPTAAPGSTCETTGPVNWWYCCTTKPAGTDKTCPPPKCGELQAGVADCCYAKGGVGADRTCGPSSPLPGGDCASRGPENLAACCAEKAANGETDASCPVPSPIAPPGATCGSTGPANWWYCCLDKPTGSDPTCPPPKCGELTTAIAECCYSKGGVANDPTCAPAASPETAPPLGSECATTGPANWWYCCADKPANSDPTCPPPSCGELTTAIAECCYSKGGWPADPSCFTKVCYNQEQTALNVADVIETYDSALEAAAENATLVADACGAALGEIQAIMYGNSANFPSTIVA